MSTAAIVGAALPASDVLGVVIEPAVKVTCKPRPEVQWAAFASELTESGDTLEIQVAYQNFGNDVIICGHRHLLNGVVTSTQIRTFAKLPE